MPPANPVAWLLSVHWQEATPTAVAWPNAFGELLEPGRARNCYLDRLLLPPPAGEPEGRDCRPASPPYGPSAGR